MDSNSHNLSWNPSIPVFMDSIKMSSYSKNTNHPHKKIKKKMEWCYKKFSLSNVSLCLFKNGY